MQSLKFIVLCIIFSGIRGLVHVTASSASSAFVQRQSLAAQSSKALLSSKESIPSSSPFFQASKQEQPIELSKEILATVLASVCGVGSAIVLRSTRLCIAKIDKAALHNPMIRCIISLIFPLIYYLQPDLTKGPVTVFSLAQSQSGSGSFSARRQVLRWVAQSLTVAIRAPFGLSSPAAEMGAALSSLVLRPLKRIQVLSIEHMQLILLAGSAAGIAANINLPLTGMSFAFEVYGRLCKGDDDSSMLQKPLIFARFLILSTVSTVSALTVMRMRAVSIAPHVLSPSVQTMTGALRIWHMTYFSLLGAIISMLCMTFTRLREVSARALHRVALPWKTRPLLGIIAMQTICLYGHTDFGLVQGNLLLRESLNTARIYSSRQSLKTLVYRMLLTPIMQATGQLGGMLAPSLFIGGSLGDLLASFFHVSGEFDRYLSIRIGALTTLGVMLRAPLTAITLQLEVCADWRHLFPLLLSLAVSISLVEKTATFFKIEKIADKRPRVIPAMQPFAFPV